MKADLAETQTLPPGTRIWSRLSVQAVPVGVAYLSAAPKLFNEPGPVRSGRHAAVHKLVVSALRCRGFDIRSTEALYGENSLSYSYGSTPFIECRCTHSLLITYAKRVQPIATFWEGRLWTGETTVADAWALVPTMLRALLAQFPR